MVFEYCFLKNIVKILASELCKLFVGVMSVVYFLCCVFKIYVSFPHQKCRKQEKGEKKEKTSSMEVCVCVNVYLHVYT